MKEIQNYRKEEGFYRPGSLGRMFIELARNRNGIYEPNTQVQKLRKSTSHKAGLTQIMENPQRPVTIRSALPQFNGMAPPNSWNKALPYPANFNRSTGPQPHAA